MLTALYEPTRMLALDINPEVAELTDFLTRHDPGGRVTAAWGVDQADSATVGRWVRDTVGDGELDLVIDDASHQLGPTRASFELLFPRIRPGGLFLIEDWSFEHSVERNMLDAMAADTTGEVERTLVERMATAEPPSAPLSVLLIELLILAASRPELVESVSLRRGWAEIRRGPLPVGGDLRIRANLGPLGAGMCDALDPT
ncbi:MAG: hypothetical protein R2695_09875 [Acidimicrobiales bacterium]